MQNILAGGNGVCQFKVSLLSIFLVIGLTALSSFLLYERFKLLTNLSVAETNNITLSENHAIAVELTKKEATRKIKEITSKYQEALNARNEAVNAYISLEASFSSHSSSTINSTSTVPVLVQDDSSSCLVQEECLVTLAGEQIETSYTDYHLALSVVSTRVNKFNWNTTISYDLKQNFSLELVETIDSKKNKTLHASLFELGDNEKHPLTISNFTIARAPTFTGFKWWDPSFRLGIHQPVLSKTGWFPCGFLAFSFSSYTKNNFIVLRFAQIGVGYNSNNIISLILTPVSYNIGHKVKLFKDVWIGLDVAMAGKMNPVLGISLSTDL